ncbi:ethylene-responsive transcription factor ERF017-like [Hibiscus syriacus]|uniref:ethylene-responsive transcription factor ERF017-like n=1 Tax=Hibiscus syriacus TaxID=106335 RepID=UPI00192178CA|nr:ethylene-responsive transcription factor ERF017-like [Hibiscus syriacus]
MVKPTSCPQSSSASPTDYVDINSCSGSSNSSKYKGVRKRKWGKWVSEIRLPNSRERIWLGSYDSAEKAARAFDAALYCLRGRGAKFNFPNNPPEIVNGQSLSPPEIQVAAARFAEETEHSNNNNNVGTEEYTSSSSVSVSDGTATTQVGGSGRHHHGEEMMDWSFLSTLDNTNYQVISDYGFYLPPGGDQFYLPPPPPPPPVDDGVNDDGNGGDAFSQSSFLWNFQSCSKLELFLKGIILISSLFSGVIMIILVNFSCQRHRFFSRYTVSKMMRVFLFGGLCSCFPG